VTDENSETVENEGPEPFIRVSAVTIIANAIIDAVRDVVEEETNHGEIGAAFAAAAVQLDKSQGEDGAILHTLRIAMIEGIPESALIRSAPPAEPAVEVELPE